MKVYFVLDIVFLCFFVAHMFSQHDYHVIHHHIEIVYQNKTIIDATVRNVKPNRTYRAYDFDVVLKRQLYGDLFKVRIHTFYFLSNEYKSSAIQFDIKVCDAMGKNIFGLQSMMKNYPNETIKCPIEPGYYRFRNFNVADENLPPNVPEGDFMLKFIGFWDKSKISELNWYGGVRYKVKKWALF